MTVLVPTHSPPDGLSVGASVGAAVGPSVGDSVELSEESSGQPETFLSWHKEKNYERVFPFMEQAHENRNDDV